MSEPIIRYTDAPEAYDGFGTRTLAVVGISRSGVASGSPVRQVAIDPEHLNWQELRYYSGCRSVTGSVGVGMLVRIGAWEIDPEREEAEA